MKKKQTVGIVSLGCPRNLVDSENILGRLAFKGHPIVDVEKADVAIVNTCAFIEEAKKESIEVILDLIGLKEEGRIKKIIVYGCLSQRYKAKLRSQLPEVDAFVGKISLNHSLHTFSITPPHYAYLKICEGCVNSCSFCIIPKIKGRFTSLNVDAILKRVELFNAKRISELTIIGQDITGYGIDLYKKPTLVPLLKRIVRAAAHINWIRLLYLYPSRVSTELLMCIRDNPRICKYLDIPIQHSNERILTRMGRATKKLQLLKLFDSARKIIPGVRLRTSLIVGFPTESEQEFTELMQFVRDVAFERLGVFAYSKEEGTDAYGFEKQVPKGLKQERLNRLMALQQQIARDVNKKFLHQTLNVLIEQVEAGVYLGRTEFDAPEVDGSVYVYAKRKLRVGEFVKVRITDTLEYDLVGQVVEA